MNNAKRVSETMLPTYVPLPAELGGALEVLNRKLDAAIGESRAAKVAARQSCEGAMAFEHRIVKLEQATSPIVAANRYASLFAMSSLVNLAVFAMLLWMLFGPHYASAAPLR